MKSQQLNWKEFLFHTLKGQLLLAGLAIAATYLITTHTAHVVQVLPFGLLLLCPLMHVFMLGGHGGHGGNHTGYSTQENNTQSDHSQDHLH